MTQLVDKLDTKIAQMTEESSIVASENLGDDRRPTFTRIALKQANRAVLMSAMNDEEVKVAFRAATIQTAKSLTKIRAAAKAPVTKEAILASVLRFVASQARTEVSVIAQQFILVTLHHRLFPPMYRRCLPIPGRKERRKI